MIPLLTPEEMRAVDDAAADSVETLVGRSGRAVARAAIAMLGGSYGRRVGIVVGPGSNGADGRVAAQALERRGVRVDVWRLADMPERLPRLDLVIDAAFGTGLSRPFTWPLSAWAGPVLAVDIPSGVDALTGTFNGAPRRADRTVTFAALKPGLVLEPGRSFCGEIIVADIGLEVRPDAGHGAGVIEASDVACWVPPLPADDHKWRRAVGIIGGRPGMEGAVHLAAAAAQRAGAGLVQVMHPGGSAGGGPTEAVVSGLPAAGWGSEALGSSERLAALLVGPGLGLAEDDVAVLVRTEVALVLDGDALQPRLVEALSGRGAATILTPHDGEWARLGGDPSPDRLEATRQFATKHGVVVVRKGSITVIADPEGRVRVVDNGSAALATAGTGDVLAGVVVGLLARRAAPADAAAAAAWIHADAAKRQPAGLVASDLIDRLPQVLERLGGTRP